MRWRELAVYLGLIEHTELCKCNRPLVLVAEIEWFGPDQFWLEIWECSRGHTVIRGDL